ncbi:MAG: MarR family winged helix-turn-helix transcriptional regulator [Rhodoglobus sp.]
MPMTDDQQRAWRSLVLATHAIEETLDRQSRRDGGIPHAYYKLLVFLYEGRSGETRMSQLADQLGYSTSRLTHAIASLERSGWVTRERSVADGRVQLVSITEAGIAIVRAVTPGQVREVREPAVGALSAEDAATLERLTVAIRAALT